MTRSHSFQIHFKSFGINFSLNKCEGNRLPAARQPWQVSPPQSVYTSTCYLRAVSSGFAASGWYWGNFSIVGRICRWVGEEKTKWQKGCRVGVGRESASTDGAEEVAGGENWCVVLSSTLRSDETDMKNAKKKKRKENKSDKQHMEVTFPQATQLLYRDLLQKNNSTLRSICM